MTTLAKVRPEKRKEFLDAMGSLRDCKLKEEGATASNWHEDPHDPNRLYFIDEWESWEDLKRYCRTVNFRVFLGALKTLCVEAEVTYGTVHGEAVEGVIAGFSSEQAWFAGIQTKGS